MYVVLLLQAERLFPIIEPITSKSQGSNLTVVSKFTLSIFGIYTYLKKMRDVEGILNFCYLYLVYFINLG